MVMSKATRAHTRRDKTPAANISAPPEVQEALESSRVSRRAANPPTPEREAYVTVGTLKNFVSTMTDAITRQVSE